MPDIRIHRAHTLGLAKARQVAAQWAEQVTESYGMSCQTLRGESSDTVSFTRLGVNGRLVVAADHFDLDAKLGFLMGAFAKTIEGEVLKNLDSLVGEAGKPAAKAAPKASAKSAAAKTGAAKPVAKKASAKAAAKKTPRGG